MKTKLKYNTVEDVLGQSDDGCEDVWTIEQAAIDYANYNHDLEVRNQELQAAIKDLQAQIEQLNDEKFAISEQVSSLRYANSQCQLELDTANASLRRLQERLDTYQDVNPVGA